MTKEHQSMGGDRQPVAWLRDAHEGEGDECLVPAAKGDLGAFPVFTDGPLNASLIAEIDAEMSGRKRGYADERGELLFRCRDALSNKPSDGEGR